MTDLNKAEDLMTVVEHQAAVRFVMDGFLDGTTPVKVLVAEAPDVPGAVIPLALLLTNDLFKRVTPANDMLNVESDEDAIERIEGGAA